MKTYEEVLRGILEIPKFTTKNSPGHTRDFLRRLGDPQEAFKVVHVAGSNGKGSVCASIASVLWAAGKHAGLFTSPHLVRIEERFVIDRAACAEEEFVEAADTVEQAAAQMVEEGLPHPTFFEYIFAVGMVIFRNRKVEYAVLETGLGGRLDATNIVRHPLLTVITSISLEHTEILGDTIEQIAREKAGILKAQVPVVYDVSGKEAAEVIARRAQALECPAYPVDHGKIKILLNTGKKIDFSYDSRYDVTGAVIPFGAPYQAVNAAVALMAVQVMRETEEISGAAVRKGLEEVTWKGRMQEAEPGIYFDGAHNEAGIRCFLQAVNQIADTPSVLLFSMVQEKNYIEAVRELLAEGRFETAIVTTIPNARGIKCERLKEVFEAEAAALHKTIRIIEEDEIEKAYARAVSVKRQEQKLFCAGSLYLIGELERITGGMNHDGF